MKKFAWSTFTILWVPLGLIAIWQVGSTALVNPFFPSPGAIGAQLMELMSMEFLDRYLFPTLLLMVTGFGVGSLLGVFFGALLGSHERIYAVLSPIAVFLRATPTAAKLPVLLGILGIGTQTIYVAVTLSVFLNVLVVTMIGVGRVGSKTVESAELLLLNPLYRALGVRLPAATGEVLTALQTALQGALLVTILAEILVSSEGIGSLLRESQQRFELVNMWVAVALAGTIGFVANELFHWLERRLAPWYFSTRAMGSL